jgi:hypothetical protein
MWRFASHSRNAADHANGLATNLGLSRLPMGRFFIIVEPERRSPAKVSVGDRLSMVVERDRDRRGACGGARAVVHDPRAHEGSGGRHRATPGAHPPEAGEMTERYPQRNPQRISEDAEEARWRFR